jgi:hypothetical protein
MGENGVCAEGECAVVHIGRRLYCVLSWRNIRVCPPIILIDNLFNLLCFPFCDHIALLVYAWRLYSAYVFLAVFVGRIGGSEIHVDILAVSWHCGDSLHIPFYFSEKK